MNGSKVTDQIFDTLIRSWDKSRGLEDTFKWIIFWQVKTRFLKIKFLIVVDNSRIIITSWLIEFSSMTKLKTLFSMFFCSSKLVILFFWIICNKFSRLVYLYLYLYFLVGFISQFNYNRNKSCFLKTVPLPMWIFRFTWALLTNLKWIIKLSHNVIIIFQKMIFSVMSNLVNIMLSYCV